MQVGVSDIRLAASDPHDRSVRAPAREGHGRLGSTVLGAERASEAGGAGEARATAGGALVGEPRRPLVR